MNKENQIKAALIQEKLEKLTSKKVILIEGVANKKSKELRTKYQPQIFNMVKEIIIASEMAILEDQIEGEQIDKEGITTSKKMINDLSNLANWQDLIKFMGNNFGQDLSDIMEYYIL